MFVEAGRTRLERFIAPAILAIALLAISGCSGGQPAKRAAGKEIRVAERDFKIAVARKRVPAGDYTLVVHNKGPDSHELIVIKAQSPRLPLRREGMTVDEGSLEHVIPGLLEPESPGTHRLKLHLTTGRYELICNMSGHYFGGMRAQLVVQ
jgi:uncharacterized cupredoxin-like copper-binding protein